MSAAGKVIDNREATRFEILVDGDVAGFAKYRLKDNEIAILHTEVKGEFEGKGLAGELVRETLQAARDAGLVVVPQCPFTSGYIRRHPEWLDIVRDDYRERLSSPAG
ncbi:N-acetyltransferase [Streptosporangiaceae bacterium NEAU-GS5]|nr:N-acetyltransferase [Streptosporangiaceae bacterium NEAU-GS5]